MGHRFSDLMGPKVTPKVQQRLAASKQEKGQ